MGQNLSMHWNLQIIHIRPTNINFWSMERCPCWNRESVPVTGSPLPASIHPHPSRRRATDTTRVEGREGEAPACLPPILPLSPSIGCIGLCGAPLLMNTDIAKVAKSLTHWCGWLNSPFASTLGPQKNGQSRSWWSQTGGKGKGVMVSFSHSAHGHCLI